MIVGYYKNYLYTTDIRSALKKEKNNNNKESQYMVSHPETGSDLPIGSDRDRGRDSFRGLTGSQRTPRNWGVTLLSISSQ